MSLALLLSSEAPTFFWCFLPLLAQRYAIFGKDVLCQFHVLLWIRTAQFPFFGILPIVRIKLSQVGANHAPSCCSFPIDCTCSAKLYFNH